MIFSTLKLVSKAATVIAVANTGYDLYKKGKVAYKTYKKSKEVKGKATKIIKGIKKVISKWK